jgi:L-methionine (R)-S-oxide reductase
MNTLIPQIAGLLGQGTDRTALLEAALAATLAEFKSETGTIHLLDWEKQLLHLAAQIGLPLAVLEVVKVIPVGKGIAGEVVARGRPVTLCNLQNDKSGVTRPGAKQTGVGGALCVPLRADGVIVGTIGVGTAREYEYSAGETALLEEVGRVLGGALGAGRP